MVPVPLSPRTKKHESLPVEGCGEPSHEELVLGPAAVSLLLAMKFRGVYLRGGLMEVAVALGCVIYP